MLVAIKNPHLREKKGDDERAQNKFGRWTYISCRAGFPCQYNYKSMYLLEILLKCSAPLLSWFL